MDAITFQELVEYGKNNGANIVNGMPWSFEYNGKPVTHENDGLYLIPASGGSSYRFTPDDILITDEAGAIYPLQKDVFKKMYEPAE